MHHALLHRESARPGFIVLCLIFIWVVWLGFGLNLELSIVEFLVQAHARQALLVEHLGWYRQGTVEVWCDCDTQVWPWLKR